MQSKTGAMVSAKLRVRVGENNAGYMYLRYVPLILSEVACISGKHVKAPASEPPPLDDMSVIFISLCHFLYSHVYYVDLGLGDKFSLYIHRRFHFLFSGFNHLVILFKLLPDTER